MNICSQPEQNKEAIDSFDGIFHFLSNFHPAPLQYEGLDYPTSEHAYQAAKTLDINQRMNIAMLETPGETKRYGKAVKMRGNWDEIKVEIMLNIVMAKFTQNPHLLEKLLATGDIELIEGNTWGDTFWGVCKGKGENFLGIILMEVRKRLNKDKDDQ